jgi:hypothetical protein
MEINDEQMPPANHPPPLEKGVPPRPRPDTGSKPDMTHPERQEQGDQPVDPVPDMDPDGMDPDEDESVIGGAAQGPARGPTSVVGAPDRSLSIASNSSLGSIGLET